MFETSRYPPADVWADNLEQHVKPVTDEQVFYDKFSYDKFLYDKFYFTGVNVSTSLL